MMMRDGVLLLVTLMALGIVILIWGKIFEKAGYPLWYGVVAMIPLANVAAWLYFAFKEWPIEEELRYAKEELQMVRDRFGLNWRERTGN